jgi:hypothetical protein
MRRETFQPGRDLKALQRAFPWYNPKAYAGAESFSACEWSLLLEYRRFALASSGEALQVAYAEIVKNPLATRQYPNISPAVEETSIVDWRLLSEHHALIKEDVDAWFATYGHLPRTRYLLGVYLQGWPPLQSLHESLLELYAQSQQEAVTAADELPRELYEAVLSKTVLSVDLRADDESLVQMFASWLSRKRAAMKDAGYSLQMQVARKRVSSRMFTEKDFKRWAKARVLDYLDIRLACRAEKTKEPSNSELARLLLSAYEDRKQRDREVDETDVIRTQTKKHASMLQRPEIIFRLHQQWLLDVLNAKAEP